MEQSAGRHRVVPGAIDPHAADSLEARLLGRPARLGGQEISDAAEVPIKRVRRFWHALGFPVVDDEEAIYTEADLAALRRVDALIAAGAIDEEFALAMTRALARTADRLSVWQTQLTAEAVTPAADLDSGLKDDRAVTDVAVAEQAAARLVELADEIEPLLVYAWRRHLGAAITRMIADADPEGARREGAAIRAVGFADLVNFTALVRRMSERQLATLVQRFEALASDVVIAHGGRVVKTVGDEVLFVHHEVAAAAAIALDLVEAMQEDPVLPPVRVGLSYGPVLARLGDVFGTTVNRASRLTSVTPPGSAFVDDSFAKALSETSGFDMVTQRRRNLRGIGSVLPRQLLRARTGRRDAPTGPTAGAETSTTLEILKENA